MSDNPFKCEIISNNGSTTSKHSKLHPDLAGRKYYLSKFRFIFRSSLFETVCRTDCYSIIMVTWSLSRDSNFPIKANNSARSDPPGPSNIGGVVVLVVVGASVLVLAHSLFVASHELLNKDYNDIKLQ